MDFNSLQAEAAGLGVLLARGAAKRAKVTLADHVDEMGDVTEKAIFRRPESTEMDAALDAVDDLFSATVSSDWDDAYLHVRRPCFVTLTTIARVLCRPGVRSK